MAIATESRQIFGVSVLGIDYAEAGHHCYVRASACRCVVVVVVADLALFVTDSLYGSSSGLGNWPEMTAAIQTPGDVTDGPRTGFFGPIQMLHGWKRTSRRGRLRWRGIDRLGGVGSALYAMDEGGVHTGGSMRRLGIALKGKKMGARSIHCEEERPGHWRVNE